MEGPWPSASFCHDTPTPRFMPWMLPIRAASSTSDGCISGDETFSLPGCSPIFPFYREGRKGKVWAAIPPCVSDHPSCRTVWPGKTPKWPPFTAFPANSGSRVSSPGIWFRTSRSSVSPISTTPLRPPTTFRVPSRGPMSSARGRAAASRGSWLGAAPRCGPRRLRAALRGSRISESPGRNGCGEARLCTRRPPLLRSAAGTIPRGKARAATSIGPCSRPMPHWGSNAGAGHPSF